MSTQPGKNNIVWFLTALLALIASVWGVVNPDIYSQVVSAAIMPGVLSQDVMTAATSVVVLFLIARRKEANATSQLVILGIMGFLFYAYGIYVIERVYNMLYLVYMAIFGLSFYSIVFSVGGIRKALLPAIGLPEGVRNISVGFLLLNPLIFYPLWISQIIPLMQTGRKIEFLYSIYILDLCFIMPAFVIVAVSAFRDKGLGMLLTPALFVMGFTLLFPLALGEFLKPLFFDQPMDTGGMGLFLVLSIVFLALAVMCLRNISIQGKTPD